MGRTIPRRRTVKEVSEERRGLRPVRRAEAHAHVDPARSDQRGFQRCRAVACHEQQPPVHGADAVEGVEEPGEREQRHRSRSAVGALPSRGPGRGRLPPGPGSHRRAPRGVHVLE